MKKNRKVEKKHIKQKMNKLKWKNKQSIHKVDKRTAQPRETPGIKKKQNEIE